MGNKLKASSFWPFFPNFQHIRTRPSQPRIFLRTPPSVPSPSGQEGWISGIYIPPQKFSPWIEQQVSQPIYITKKVAWSVLSMDVWITLLHFILILCLNLYSEIQIWTSNCLLNLSTWCLIGISTSTSPNQTALLCCPCNSIASLCSRHFSTLVNGIVIYLVAQAKNWRIILNSSLSFTSHIQFISTSHWL